MKTTLNLPDSLVLKAKQRALLEGCTLTDLLVQGLTSRLERYQPEFKLPVSSATGGLTIGTTWENLIAAEPESEWYR